MSMKMVVQIKALEDAVEELTKRLTRLEEKSEGETFVATPIGEVPFPSSLERQGYKHPVSE